jgi:hypothetical protein
MGVIGVSIYLAAIPLMGMAATATVITATVILLNFHLLFFPLTSAVQKSTNLLNFFHHLIMDPISQRLRVSSIKEGREMNSRFHRTGHWLHI